MKIYNRKETKTLRSNLRQKQTDAERILWSRLRNKQMNGFKFFRQYGIGRYIADFYCPRIKVVIEIDGGGHYTKEGQEYDAIRSEALKSSGISILRFSNTEVLNQLDSVLERIWELTPPTPSLTKEGETKNPNKISQESRMIRSLTNKLILTRPCQGTETNNQPLASSNQHP